MNRIGLAIILILLTAVVVVYWRFGAVSNLEYTSGETEDLQLWGILYEGRPTQQELKDAFNQVQSEAVRREEPFYVVTYPSAENTIHQFLGLKEGTHPDWKKQKVLMGKDIRVLLDVSTAWMPSPENVWEGAQEYAGDHGLELRNYSVEIYRIDQPIEVRFPVGHK